MRPRRRQPPRLPRSWDSPGKNTGVGHHFLLQCMKVESESEVAQPGLTLRDPMDHSPPGSSVHGIVQARSLLRKFKKFMEPRCGIFIKSRISEESSQQDFGGPGFQMWKAGEERTWKWLMELWEDQKHYGGKRWKSFLGEEAEVLNLVNCSETRHQGHLRV